MYSFWKDRWYFFFSEHKCKFENFDQSVDGKKSIQKEKLHVFSLLCVVSLR